MESNDPRKQWAAIKSLKKKRSPNFTKLKDKDGLRVGPRRRAEAIAEYLQDVQWKEPDLPPRKAFRPNVVQDHLDFNIGPIDLRELEEHLFAQVVTIFKKGDTQKISNYRPISLLNIAYKLYASIIQKRLATYIDPMISRTQFGFRHSRSTTHALYVARRLQDISEQSGDTVIMTLLDWEKAFDRMAHSRMIEALERMNIPVKLRNVIAGFFSDPKFYVTHDQTVSTSKTQAAGIRQGCPLSPYLFVLVMTVMFKDIHDEINVDICNCRLDRINFSEILYADDTLLVTKNTKGMNKLIHAIERESAYYGLKHNQSKCCVLVMNGNNRIKFLDGSSVPQVDEVTYLGGTLTSQVSVANEVSNRIAAATSTWMSLRIFWKQAHCSAGNKIRIFDAVVKSRLLYGLQTLEIPDAQMSRLEAFHYKGLRQIVRMETTFMNRANTNNEVLRRANLATRSRNNPNNAVCRISETLKYQRIALTGHILRQDHSHPLRNVSFRPNTAIPFEVMLRRVGRPRRKWLDSSLSFVWDFLRPNTEFSQSNEQLTYILNAARNNAF